ncbi:hypothetical protein C8Q78DRAFT_1040358 [Trametes maxima]|nr:hypothetical protein C8Q78DRAFT_1040358 [Trametes maxima]
MSDLGYNVWGVVAGIIGTVAVIPALAFWLLGPLPTAKLTILEALLEDTTKMFREAIEEGLIYREDDLRRFHAWFWTIKVRLDDARLEVYDIKTWRDELASWWDGLSGRIHIVCKDTYRLRFKLAKASSRERRALAASGHTTRLASLSGIRGRASHIASFLLPPDTPVSVSPLPRPEEPPHRPSPPSDCEPSFVDEGKSSLPVCHTGSGCSWDSPITAGQPSLGEAHSVLHLCDTPVVSDASKHHPLCDTDLYDVFALGIAQPRARIQRNGGRHHRRATQHDVLLHFGRQLFGGAVALASSPSLSSSKCPRTHARIKAALRLMQLLVANGQVSANVVGSSDVESVIIQQTGSSNDRCDEPEDDWHDVV